MVWEFKFAKCVRIMVTTTAGSAASTDLVVSAAKKTARRVPDSPLLGKNEDADDGSLKKKP